MHDYQVHVLRSVSGRESVGNDGTIPVPGRERVGNDGMVSNSGHERLGSRMGEFGLSPVTSGRQWQWFRRDTIL